MAELITCRTARDLMLGGRKIQEAVISLNKEIEEAAVSGINSVTVGIDTLPRALRVLLMESSFRYEVCLTSGYAKISW